MHIVNNEKTLEANQSEKKFETWESDSHIVLLSDLGVLCVVQKNPSARMSIPISRTNNRIRSPR